MIKSDNGDFLIIDSSAHGLEKIQRDGETQLNFSSSDIPAHLKCALTGNLLRDAVALPCCGKLVDDTSIRQKLLNSLTCPFCSTSGISPDSVRIKSQFRCIILLCKLINILANGIIGYNQARCSRSC